MLYILFLWKSFLIMGDVNDLNFDKLRKVFGT